MFKSNQARLKSYVSERRIEEANAEDHQAKLYNKLAIERGELDQAAGLARLAKRVVNNIGDILVPSVEPTKDGAVYIKKKPATDYLSDAIKNGTLDQLFNKMMNLDLKVVAKLGKGARIVLEDLKNPNSGVKDATNEALLEILKSNKDEATKQMEMLKAINDNLAGGNQIYLEELAKAAMRREERTKRINRMEQEYMEEKAKSEAKHEFKSPELKAAKEEFESGDFELPQRTNNIDPKIDTYLQALNDKKYKTIIDDLYNHFIGVKTNKKVNGKAIELKRKAVELHKTNVNAYRELLYYLQNAYEFNILGMNPDEEEKASIPTSTATIPAASRVARATRKKNANKRISVFDFNQGRHTDAAGYNRPTNIPVPRRKTMS